MTKKQDYSRQELLDVLHWLTGAKDTVDLQFAADFIDFRSRRTDLADWIGKKSIKKSEAIAKLLELKATERRKLIMSRQKLIPLLPKDVKILLKVKEIPEDLNAITRRTFNPGRRIEFDVYSIFEVLGRYQESCLN